MAALGIAHWRTQIASPWQNRIERMFGTLKEKLRLVSPQNGHALDVLLEDFALWYNHARPHAHLHGWTPAQAWLGINPFITAPLRIEKFEAWAGLLQGYVSHYPAKQQC